MAAANNTFEGGTNTTTITTGNSGGGSGNAFDVVNIGSGSGVTFDNTHAHTSSLAGKMASGTGNGATVRWSTTIGSQTQVWGRQYIYITANPSADLSIFSNGFDLYVTSTGKVKLVGIATATSTNSLTLNQWNRIEHRYNAAVSGTFEAQLFVTDPDATSPTETIASTGNYSGISVSTYDFGVFRTGTSGTMWIDDININTTAYPGPALKSIPNKQLIVLQSIVRANYY